MFGNLPNFLLFSERCAVCGEKLKGKETAVCQHCWFSLQPEPEEDAVYIPHLDGYRTAFPYKGVGGEILKLIKFSGFKSLAYEVGKLAEPTFREYVERIKPHWVTFVPTNPWRYWFKRGFHPAEELLKGTGVPYKKLIVRSWKPRKSLSAAKNLEERKRLVEGVFNLKPRYAGLLEGKRILTVDDVLTSGTTASKLAFLFKSVGAAEVYLFAFFRE